MFSFIKSGRLAVALALGLFLPCPLGAQAKQTGYFSVEGPADWFIEERGDTIIISPIDSSEFIDDYPFSIMLTKVPQMNLEALAKELADDNKLTKLGRGYAFTNALGGYRHWVFGYGSALVELQSIEEDSDKIPAIMASIKITEAAPAGSDEALKAAQDQKVIDWLTFQ